MVIGVGMNIELLIQKLALVYYVSVGSVLGLPTCV